jgi:hypothetical protein
MKSYREKIAGDVAAMTDILTDPLMTVKDGIAYMRQVALQLFFLRRGYLLRPTSFAFAHVVVNADGPYYNCPIGAMSLHSIEMETYRLGGVAYLESLLRSLTNGHNHVACGQCGEPVLCREEHRLCRWPNPYWLPAAVDQRWEMEWLLAQQASYRDKLPEERPLIYRMVGSGWHSEPVERCTVCQAELRASVCHFCGVEELWLDKIGNKT